MDTTTDMTHTASPATNLRQWLCSLAGDNGGGVTPELVREAARPNDSPAHGYVFNVPIAEAAELHYLERAHKLIQTVRVRYEPAQDKEPIFVRLFHAVIEENGDRVYVDYDRLMQRPDLFVQVRAEATRRVADAMDVLDKLETVARDPSRLEMVSAARDHLRTAQAALNGADDE